ncbi:MAG: SMC family ATPase [Nocardioides sp.]
MPAEAEVGRLRHEVADLDSRRTGLAAQQAAAVQAGAVLPERLVTLREAAHTCAAAAAGVPAAQAAVRLLRERLAARHALTALMAEREGAVGARAAAVDHAQSLKETWLGLQERRITGMAAELADGLAVGGSCPVCGSCEHPHPAARAHDAPDADAVRRARSSLDDAEAARLAHEEKVRDLDTRIARLEPIAGQADAASVEDELAAAEQELAALAEVAGRHGDTQAELAATEASAEALARQVAALGHERAAATSLFESRRRDLADAEARVAGALAGSGCASLAELAARDRDRGARCQAAAQAVGLVEERRRAARSSRRRWQRAATAAGFDDAEETRTAWLDPVEQESLEAELRAVEAELAAAQIALADPDLIEAAGQPEPDLSALRADAEEGAATARAAAADATVLEQRLRRLTALHTDLAAALRAWRPVQEELAVVTRLAGLVEGRSADNRWQMRLSAYVLGYRLRQVVAAANSRLAGMSDRRYSLEHTDRRGAGETRGGLSLVVRDDWTGETRDPATLSGGETFVVSLALALGLADVITAEAGGADLDTLVVDEGFGSLDAETLDDVLAVLDALRDGGRVVGVVSHVPEMRDRIPVQLAVTKGRHGSTAQLRLGENP